MRILSELLTRENEDYLTIPAIRKFAKTNNIKKIIPYYKKSKKSVDKGE